METCWPGGISLHFNDSENIFGVLPRVEFLELEIQFRRSYFVSIRRSRRRPRRGCSWHVTC